MNYNKRPDERFLSAQLIYMKLMYNYHQLNQNQAEWVRRYLLKSIMLFHNRYIQSKNNSDKLVASRLSLALAMFTLNWILESEADLSVDDLFSETFKSFKENISLDVSGSSSFQSYDTSVL